MRRSTGQVPFVCFAALLGCATYSEQGEPSGATCDPRLSYAVDAAPILSRYCVSCHASVLPLSARRGAPGNHDFDTEDAVRENAVHIDWRAGSGVLATNRSMPPAGYPAPTDAERKALARYLACVIEDEGHEPHEH